MTAEWNLKQFSVCSLIVEYEPYGEVVQVARLSSEQRLIFTQLSLETPTKILKKNLQPPPS